MATERKIRSLRFEDAISNYRIVDLSLTLDDKMPCVWPGHMQFEHKIYNWYTNVDGPGQPLMSRGPYYSCWVTLDEHVGTHFDAPTHFIPPPQSYLPHASEFGAMYGDKVPLDILQGPAVVVDVRDLAENSPIGASLHITPEFLANWEERHGRFVPGEAVLLYSGWDRFYVPYPEGYKYTQGPVLLKNSPGWPAPSAEAVVYLFERGVRLLATDAPSIGGADEAMTMHYAGLERGMAYVESLTGLAELPIRGSYFMFMPVKVARSSGGSGRAMAYVPNDAQAIG